MTTQNRQKSDANIFLIKYAFWSFSKYQMLQVLNLTKGDNLTFSRI